MRRRAPCRARLTGLHPPGGEALVSVLLVGFLEPVGDQLAEMLNGRLGVPALRR